MNEGIIELDSEAGKLLGFTSDKFKGYLWKTGDAIYISTIMSRDQGKGNLRTLFDRIWELGFTVKVPTPFARMQFILERLGFEKIIEDDNQINEACEVWVKTPTVDLLTTPL